jgi:hypothetical protein
MRKRVTVRFALLRRRSRKFCGIVFAMTNKSKISNCSSVARKFTATNKTARQHNHTSKKNISENCLPRNGERIKNIAAERLVKKSQIFGWTLHIFWCRYLKFFRHCKT